jgi:hypothetical protein
MRKDFLAAKLAHASRKRPACLPRNTGFFFRAMSTAFASSPARQRRTLAGRLAGTWIHIMEDSV